MPPARVVPADAARHNWTALFNDLHKRVGTVTDPEVALVISRNPCNGREVTGLFMLGKLKAAEILGDERLFKSLSPSQASFLLLDENLSLEQKSVVLSRWAEQNPRSAAIWAELSNHIMSTKVLESFSPHSEAVDVTRMSSLESVRSIDELLRSLGREPSDTAAYASLYWSQPFSNLLHKAASEIKAGKDITAQLSDYGAAERFLDLLGAVSENKSLSNDDYENLLITQYEVLEFQRKKAGIPDKTESENANLDWRANQQRLGVLFAIPEILAQSSTEEGELFLRSIETIGSLAAVDDYIARNPESLPKLKCLKIEPGSIPN